MSEKTVFISYRRDATGRLFGRSIKEALTHHGYDVFLDVDCVDAGKWAAQILAQVPKRAHFLLLLTPGALDRCLEDDDWVRKEFLQAVASGRNVVPVREESVDVAELRHACPACVRALFEYQIAAVRHSGFDDDIETLIERFIPPHKAPAGAGAPRDRAAAIPADISRIDRYAPADLVGREAETALLSGAWDKAVRGEPKRPHVLTIVALGGEGKTSLVAKWAASLAGEDWPGCDAAFAWSFFSQGTRDQAAASSDTFLKDALIFFGDPALAAGAQDAVEKGRRLAQLVGGRRALLILDGLEPLQYAPTSPAPGELKEKGLAALLKGLASSSHGLCIVTTRYSIPDLRAYWQTTAPEEKLLRLSRTAGVALLRKLGVKGTQREFETLVEDVKGHALTLNLLGTYLCDAHAGDIRKRDLVKLEDADAEEQGGHAFQVMDAYVMSLETGGKTAEENARGRRALALLRLMGLFDRPAMAGCLEALWNGDAIPGITDPLVGLSEPQRSMALTRLEQARLLTVNRDAAGTLLALDAHPLIREYFARRLRERPEAWRAAHRRLYDHLCATTKEGDQPTLDDLRPLYQAVAHGCLAGLQEEARATVYRDRILRGTGSDGFYSAKKLGALGSDLGAIACFFETPWSRVSPALSDTAEAWLLNEAATRLRALGRMTEALEPMRKGAESAVRREDWENAARACSSLSELELTIGDLAGAVGDAEQSVAYADRSGDAGTRVIMRTSHADALHQAGRRAEAGVRFREAEEIQAERQPDYPLLHSVQGFLYCDLLLTAAERGAWRRTQESGDRSQESGVRSQESELLDVCRAVEQRAAQTLKWYEAKKQQWLLTIALDHLTLGRAALYRALMSGIDVPAAPTSRPRDEGGAAAVEHLTIATAREELDDAVAGLRRAGTQHMIPLALLTRAWCSVAAAAAHRLHGDHTPAADCVKLAQTDLDEAWDIAERGPMPLFLADIHLHRARLFFREAVYPWTSPQADLAEARRLIEKHGYWRRKEELEDAERVILGRDAIASG